ncbi:hypothetical protein R1flu_018667 [Riccia fluitans]|uniref:Uncharacterized protein n=1 Tax=Riccia fluitans TaxID=41844 RepID=A0ABD1ZKF4_9MARC
MSVSEMASRTSTTKKASVAKKPIPRHVFPLPGFFPRYGQYIPDEDETEEVVEVEKVEKEATLPDNTEELIVRKPPVIYCSALLRLIDEGLEMLWGLSYLTDEFLSRMDQRFSDPAKEELSEILKNEIPYEIYDALLLHVDLLFNWERAVLAGEKESLSEAEGQLGFSAWVLARLFIEEHIAFGNENH